MNRTSIKDLLEKIHCSEETMSYMWDMLNIPIKNCISNWKDLSKHLILEIPSLYTKQYNIVNIYNRHMAKKYKILSISNFDLTGYRKE